MRFAGSCLRASVLAVPSVWKHFSPDMPLFRCFSNLCPGVISCSSSTYMEERLVIPKTDARLSMLASLSLALWPQTPFLFFLS